MKLLKSIFNTDEIVKHLDDHKEGKADNSRKIWTIYMFLVWYEDFGNELKLLNICNLLQIRHGHS